MWARKYKECINCKTTIILYEAKGLCKKCYDKSRRFKTRITTKIWKNEKFFNGNRFKVLNRDKHCLICKKDFDLVVHHKNYKKRSELKDLITLCRSCHTKLHNFLRLREYFKGLLRRKNEKRI